MAQSESEILTKRELKRLAYKIGSILPKDLDPEKVRKWLNEKNSYRSCSRDSLYSVIRKALMPMPIGSSVSVRIEIDYNISLPDMAEKGNYKTHDIDRLRRYFPLYWQYQKEKEFLNVEMKFFDQTMWPEDVLYALKISGYSTFNNLTSACFYAMP